ncbi:MAG TPA: hypothetical protein VLA12_24295, partial [Planctomycetaceae bacterium]|nr:hypothetical protein [Planctomycetaceae bacterium]
MSRIEKPSKPDPSEGDRFREPLLGGLPPRLFWERLLEEAIGSTRAEGALLWEVQTDRDGLSPVAYRGSEPLKAALGG